MLCNTDHDGIQHAVLLLLVAKVLYKWLFRIGKG